MSNWYLELHLGNMLMCVKLLCAHMTTSHGIPHICSSKAGLFTAGNGPGQLTFVLHAISHACCLRLSFTLNHMSGAAFLLLETHCNRDARSKFYPQLSVVFCRAGRSKSLTFLCPGPTGTLCVRLHPCSPQASQHPPRANRTQHLATP